MAQLFRRETSCFIDLGSIPGRGKIMNVLVFYLQVNMVPWALFSNEGNNNA